MRRTGTTDLDVNACVNDILIQFPKRDRNFLVNSIRNGSMGKYGINYKVTANVIGYWIYQHSKEGNEFNPNQQPAN